MWDPFVIVAVVLPIAYLDRLERRSVRQKED